MSDVKAKTGQVAPHGSKSNGNLEMDEMWTKCEDLEMERLDFDDSEAAAEHAGLPPQMSLRGSWSWVHGNSPNLRVQWV